MRKNQKYSKEEMYLAVELWQESGLSQVKFCSREKLSVKTFSYWLRKYRKEKGVSTEGDKKVSDTFIPVEISKDAASAYANSNSGRIDVSFPNGVQLSCPVGIDIGQLKTLINL
ncbi:MAG TPA: transposase [Bacteroidales bacterium]|nr:transposase [Bacteroidales bacterium]